jgi:minor extracellular serine protease Vpr
VKTNLLLIALVLLVVSALQAQEQTFPEPRLSASARLFLWKLKNQKQTNPGVFPENVYRLDAQNRTYIQALMEVFPNMPEAGLRDLGIKIGTRAGNIWTAQVPLEHAEAFSKLNGIRFLEMDQASAPDLDSARRRTRVDSVHKGQSLTQAYSGKGVVVGVIDAGFDYTHPTFYDTTYSRFRVKRVWEEKTIGTPPTQFSYGSEFTDSASILTKAFDITDGTHGTHVAGIAGGSGYLGPNGNNRRFRGMAFESDLVFVAIYPTAAYWLNTGMTDMLDGINYTFQYAALQGKPAVANLSWGCPLGPRDGSSLFSKALDNLVGPGKVFVVSGGNNGQNRIHIGKVFTPTDTVLNTFLTFPSGLPQKINQVDVWGDTAKSFCMQFSLYTGSNRISESAWVCLDDSVHQIFLIGANGDTCFITATAVAQEFNQKPRILIQATSRVADALCLTVKATEGKVNLWQGIVVKTSGYYGTFAKNGQAWARDGDFQMTCGDLVSTRKAIAVAAYNSKVNFTNVSGQMLSYPGYNRGRIANFSSFGPTADGRIKPNIAGPGMALASSVSSFDSSYMTGGADYDVVVSKNQSSTNGRTYSYGMAGGTSMSAPATSGIVAILMEANPTLDPAQVLDLFRQTAITDTYTGVIPAQGNNIWGFGKVNAMGSLRKVLETTGIRHSRIAQSVLVFPNPGSEKITIKNLTDGQPVLAVKILDSRGRLIHQLNGSVPAFNSNGVILDCSHIPAGMYWIHVQTADGPAVVQWLKDQ